MRPAWIHVIAFPAAEGDGVDIQSASRVLTPLCKFSVSITLVFVIRFLGKAIGSKDQAMRKKAFPRSKRNLMRTAVLERGAMVFVVVLLPLRLISADFC